MMFNRKQFPVMLLFCCCVLLFSGCTSSPKPTAENPFSIAVEPVQVDQTEGRIIINTEINNTTDAEFHDVSYTLTLNEEAQPYIASQQMTYAPVTAAERMNVVSEKTAASASNLPDNTVCGFSSEWDMLLTTKEDLAEYENKQPEGLYDAVQNLTVEINWDGGSQSEIIPLVWENETDQ